MRIQLTGIRHASTETVAREVASGDIISDASAAAIASWWQSPIGRYFAALASGAAVDTDDVRHDIGNLLRSPDQDDARAEMQALAAWVDARECECSEDDGPCERHCEVLAQREGASLHTADELALVFLDDALGIDPACLSPYGKDVKARAESALSDGSSWISDPDVHDALSDVVNQVESYLSPLLTFWEDGYRIVRVTGGPLADD